MTLNRWFQRNASRPLMLASVFVGLVWVMLLLALSYEISYQRLESTRHLANLLNLSIGQKNRVLTEALLESSHINMGAQAAAICNNGKVLVSSNTSNSYCTDSESWLYPKINFDIPGTGDYTLVVTFSRFSDRANIWRFFLFGLIFTGGCYVLLYQIKKRFWRDIFLPLQEGVFNDTPMPISEFEQVRKKRKIIVEAKEREAVLQAVLDNKSKVAHNIKSPLRTLRLIQQEVKGMISQREAKLLDSVIDSINNILGNQQAALNPKSETTKNITSETQSQEAVLLSDFLEESINQKSAEYARLKSISIMLDQAKIPFGTFVSVVRHEFRAILSNLINNSVEAMPESKGEVEITASAENGFVRIIVCDSGAGVAEADRERIFEKGVSSKENGTGYGLYHARQYLAQWGGIIRYATDSSSRGASFEILLPGAKPPQWFVGSLDLRQKKNIVVFDDDVLIHRLWKDRLQALGNAPEAKVHFVSTESEFEACLEKIGAEVSESLILCDYDLGLVDRSGFDIVRSFGVGSLTKMVTNNFQNRELIGACAVEQIQILPKPCIYAVPLIV